MNCCELFGQNNPDAVGGESSCCTVQETSGTCPNRSSLSKSSSKDLRIEDESESPSLPLSAYQKIHKDLMYKQGNQEK